MNCGTANAAHRVLLWAAFALCVSTLTAQWPSGEDWLIFYDSEVEEVRAIDPKTCQTKSVCSVTFPAHFTDTWWQHAADKWLFGLCFDGEGRLLVANYRYLMHIDTETGVLSVIDSLVVDRSDLNNTWGLLGLRPDGLLLIAGIANIRLYDLLNRRVVHQWTDVDRRGWSLGWGFIYLDGMIVHGNPFPRTFDVRDPHTLELLRQVPLSSRSWIYLATYSSRSCDGGDVFGWSNRPDSTILRQVSFSDGTGDTLCIFTHPILSEQGYTRFFWFGGLASPFSLYERRMDVVSARSYEVDLLGCYSMERVLGCYEQDFPLIDFQVYKCFGIDSISIDGPSGMALTGEGLEARRAGWRWTNTAGIPDEEVNAQMSGWTASLPEAVDTYRVSLGIYTGPIRTTMYLDLIRPETSCIEEGRDFYFPNAFSPNGDGVNDRYEVFLGSHLELTDFKIYSGRGQLVYQMEAGSAVSWSGEDMLPGVYLYTGQLRDRYSGATVGHHGHVHLIK